MKWKITIDRVKDGNYISWIVDADTKEEAADRGRELIKNAGITEPDLFEVSLEVEDKQEICNKLLEALKLTRHLCSLEELTYNGNEVIATFSDGYSKMINVECDSGIALIIDVLKRLI